MPSDTTTCRDVPAIVGTGHPVHPKGRKARPGCGATWRMSSNAAHCVRCHQTFASPALADLHDDKGEGRCRSGFDVGLYPDENKWGTVVWRRNPHPNPPTSHHQRERQDP